VASVVGAGEAGEAGGPAPAVGTGEACGAVSVVNTASAKGKAPAKGNASAKGKAPAKGNAPASLTLQAGEGAFIEETSLMPSCGSATLGEAAHAARVAELARMVAASRERSVVIADIIADRAAQLRTPWPQTEPRMGLPSSRREHQRDGRAHQVQMEPEVPGTLAMTPAQRSLFRTDHIFSLPRRPRRSFVRRAAVM